MVNSVSRSYTVPVRLDDWMPLIFAGFNRSVILCPYRACKSRGETMRDFRLPEPFDYRSDILTLEFLSRKSSLCLKTS